MPDILVRLSFSKRYLASFSLGTIAGVGYSGQMWNSAELLLRTGAWLSSRITENITLYVLVISENSN